ncbi:hypothetical protein ABZ352_18915 [Streptomyces griseofuscus]|uniref:hypothetical protein n=1 Tax=Streptomyces griseofuscus TaxID=146922 RepID=UPI0034108428
MKTRALPLTLRWYLLLWRSDALFAAGPIRTHQDGQARSIGGTVTVGRLTVGLARLGNSTTPLRTRSHWARDFGGRFISRYGIGGWHSTPPVPLSTGWTREGRSRTGVTVTIASRTLYLIRLCSAAEYRASRDARRAQR